MRPLEFLLGVFVVANVLWDVFQSVVVPRPTPGFRPASVLARLTWPLWRRVSAEGCRGVVGGVRKAPLELRGLAQRALARNWAVPAAQWIGDRSYMPHAEAAG